MNVLSLEDFFAAPETTSAEATSGTVPSAELEAARLAGYDAGYQAGWDDALKSSEMEHTHIQAEFARNLEELSFTFFEARRQVCFSLKPLVAALVNHVAPELMRAHFTQLLEQTLLPQIEEQSQTTVDLVCAPEDEALLKELLAQQDRLPVALRTEPTFSQGQVRFALGHETHEVDAAALLENIQRCTTAFFEDLQEEEAHG